MIRLKEIENWLEDIRPIILDISISKQNLFQLKNAEYKFLDSPLSSGYYQHAKYQLQFVLAIQISKLLSKSSEQKRSFIKLFNRFLCEKYDELIIGKISEYFTEGSKPELISFINRLQDKINNNKTAIGRIIDVRDKSYAHSDPGYKGVIHYADIKDLYLLINDLYKSISEIFIGEEWMSDLVKDWEINSVLKASDFYYENLDSSYFNNQILPEEAIQERDIDLILIEEFRLNPSFSQWFLEKLSLPPLEINEGAFKRISDFNLGEADVLFSYKSEGKNVFLLIENKLDTSFQELQYERYGDLLARYIEDKKCDIGYIILVAPNIYEQSDFEFFISYEEIQSYFFKEGTKRSNHKAQLLQIAINKQRRKYIAVNSEPAQNFWKKYWKIKESTLPDFFMKKPTVVLAGRDWPVLIHPHLPKVKFYHKWAQGNVDATFNEWDDDLIKRIQSKGLERIKFIQHGKLFSLRISTSKIDKMGDFQSQIDQINKGFDDIKELMDVILSLKQ